MAPSSKQAKRAEQKTSKKKEDDEPAAGALGDVSFLPRVKTLFLQSFIAQTLPMMQDLLQDKLPEKEENGNKDEKENEENENAETNGEGKEDEAKVETNGNHKNEGDTPAKMFNSIRARLAWYNALGLAEPASGEDALKAWVEMKGLELDFGPRAKRKGNPGLERIQVNVINQFPQYLHLLLALMMLRALLFRSWFACLPWLVGYQFLSVFVPLEGLAQLPQVPWEKCPPKFRVAGTVGLHALVWLFFVYEALWCTYFFEKIPLAGLFAYHAYAVRPQGS
jgi:hypothetical protein